MADTWEWPSKGDEATLLKRLDALDGEADEAHKDASKQWDDNARQYRGDQWRVRRPPYFLANIVRNQVLRKVGSLTETKPRMRVHALEPGLEKSAIVVHNAVKAVWDRGDTDVAVYRLCLAADLFGAGFMMTTYDPQGDEITVSFVDPRRVRFDPMVTSFDEFDKAQYVRIDTIMPLAELRARFPGRGALVPPDERMSSYTERSSTRHGLLASVLAAMPRPYKPGVPAKAGPIARAEVREYWVMDPQLNEQGASLFPGGRHIIRAGSIVLVDEYNPYWDGAFPIDMFVWDIDPDTAWGLDEVQGLRRIQEAINRMGDSWIRNMLLGSNFKIIADMDALDPDEWEKLDSDAGLVIRKRPQRELRYEPPVPASAETPMALQQLIQLCEFLTGNSDAQRSVASQAASLEGLQAARQTLVRDVARRLEATLQRVGQKLVSRTFQFMTGDKILFQQGPTREWIAYTYKRQQLLMDDAGKMRSSDATSKLFREYRFMITPESSLATTRIQRTLAALQLRAATGVAPSVRRILEEADLGDPDLLISEGLEELKVLPQPPPPKGRGGKR